MALPLVNVTPNYELIIPSTGQRISFRPYLVKEEKVLLMAFESQDTRSILRAMIDTIASCITEDIDINTLTTFDVEYMFLKIRGKSVGEGSTVMIKCKSCEADNEVTVNLDNIEIDVPKKDNVVTLSPTVSVEMKYPSYTDMINSDMIGGDKDADANDIIRIVIQGISAILTEEERFDVKDYSYDDLVQFVEQLTSDQFMKLNSFFDDMPQLKHNVEFKCESCGEDNQVELAGMADFF
jgi:hypothetical protein